MDNLDVLTGLNEINKNLKAIRNHLIKLRIDVATIRQSSTGNRGGGVLSPQRKNKNRHKKKKKKPNILEVLT